MAGNNHALVWHNRGHGGERHYRCLPQNMGAEVRASFLRDFPHLDRCPLAGFCGLLRCGYGVAVGNCRGIDVCCDCPFRYAPACRIDNRIFPAWTVGPVARTSSAWRLVSVRARPTECDPACLRSFLFSFRLLHGRVFLQAARRMECCAEGSATVSMREMDLDLALAVIVG